MFHDKTMLGAGFPASPAPVDALQALAGFDALGTTPVLDRHDASCALPAARKGTWFDEGFDFREPEGNAFADKVLDQLAAVETRSRRRRAGDQVNHETLVRKLLANGLRCFHFHKPAKVAIQRRADRYKGKPQWLSGMGMARATNLLAKAGLAEVIIGRQGLGASTFEPTPALLDLAQEAGITEHSLTYRMPCYRLVRLREGNRKTDLMPFAPTGQTRFWTAQLDAFNAFLAEQDIGIDLTEDEAARLTARMNAERPKGTLPFTKPELIRKDLYRQFNNGCFEQGGRLYGGWWINCPTDLRPSITINGKPTVELDYSGCMIRMIYHERGMDYEDDPYWIEPLDACERENGLPGGQFREAVKRMMQALINGKEGKRNERIRMPSKRTFKPFFARKDIMEMLKVKHSPIADAFQTGAGVRLQRTESDIALKVIMNLMAKGVPVLPVHDSFIAPAEHRNELMNEMSNVYKERIGSYPIIK